MGVKNDRNSSAIYFSSLKLLSTIIPFMLLILTKPSWAAIDYGFGIILILFMFLIGFLLIDTLETQFNPEAKISSTNVKQTAFFI